MLDLTKLTVLAESKNKSAGKSTGEFRIKRVPSIKIPTVHATKSEEKRVVTS